MLLAAYGDASMNDAGEFMRVSKMTAESTTAVNPKNLFSQITTLFTVSCFIEVFYPN